MHVNSSKTQNPKVNSHAVLAVMQNIPAIPAKSVATVFAEGAAAAGRPCISGTYLPHALLHAGDTPSTRMFAQAPCLRRHNRGSQTIPVRFARETLINSFRAGRPRPKRPVSLCAADAGECPVVLLDGNAIHALRLERGAYDGAI